MNTLIDTHKDYMIVRYVATQDFPILTIHKSNIYTYDGVEQDHVDVKIKPVQRGTYNYYIMHRTDDVFADLYSYSFNKAIDYIMI
jgi:hypothetical protein